MIVTHMEKIRDEMAELVNGSKFIQSEVELLAKLLDVKDDGEPIYEWIDLVMEDIVTNTQTLQESISPLQKRVSDCEHLQTKFYSGWVLPADVGGEEVLYCCKCDVGMVARKARLDAWCNWNGDLYCGYCTLRMRNCMAAEVLRLWVTERKPIFSWLGTTVRILCPRDNILTDEEVGMRKEEIAKIAKEHGVTAKVWFTSDIEKGRLSP